MQIKRVKTSELKFDRDLVKVTPSVSMEVPVVVDKDMNVIFGDSVAMKNTELDVLVVDLPFKETRLAMHSTGRWAEPNWTKLKAEDAPRYGYSAFIDGFLFKEVPQKLGLDRHPEKSAEHSGDLF